VLVVELLTQRHIPSPALPGAGSMGRLGHHAGHGPLSRQAAPHAPVDLSIPAPAG